MEIMKNQSFYSLHGASGIRDLAISYDRDNLNMSTTAPHQQMLSDREAFYLKFYLFIIFGTFMAVFGIINNVINVLIFYRLGLKDSMSVCLFGLSFTDFLVSFVVLLTRIFDIWGTYFPSETIDTYQISLVGLDFPADSLFLCSGWIMSILSLERCVCVIFPFHVKRIFTAKRSFITIIVIHVIIQGINIPFYASSWLEWVREDLDANGTTFRYRLKTLFADNHVQLESYVELLKVTVIPIPSLVVILGSVFWMIYGLYASSQTRQAMTMTVSKTNKDGRKGGSNMDARTLRLIKVVLFLAILFIVLSIPRTFATFINLANPQIDYDGKEKNFSIVAWNLTRLFSAINASVNIFVYITVNSSYRRKFQEMFCCANW